MTALLTVHDLAVSYGSAGLALSGVDLTVDHGEVVALLGANGAGKTTLIRAVTGTHRYYGAALTRGTIALDGKDVTNASPGHLVDQGLVQVPEGRRILAQLTVEENLRAGAIARSRGGRDPSIYEPVYELFPILAERRRQRAGFLSGGEQQMLAIGRALVTRPRLLLLDEPTLGLAPTIVEKVGEIVRELNSRGVSVLLVEQNAATALTLADRAYILRFGEVAAAGTATEIAASDIVQTVYLGGDDQRPAAAAPTPRPDPEPAATAPPRDDAPILSARDVTVSFGAVKALTDVSIEVRRGHVTALVGPNGAGKSTLLNCLSGALTHRGTVTFDGRDIHGMSPTGIARLGVARTFQHPVAPTRLSVHEVVLLGRERLMRRGMIAAAFRTNGAEEQTHVAYVDDLLERLHLADYAASPVAACPYGVQKRVDLARALAMEPSLLLMDEPFAGLHREEAEEMMAVVSREVASADLAVLLVDHNVDVVFARADHVVVLDFGTQVTAGPPDVVRRDPRVVEASLGRNAGV